LSSGAIYHPFYELSAYILNGISNAGQFWYKYREQVVKVLLVFGLRFYLTPSPSPAGTIADERNVLLAGEGC
jgi:hypothetical protein